MRELLVALEELPAASDEHFVLYAREPWGDLDPNRFRWELNPLPDPLWHFATARRANKETRAFLSTNSYLTAWFTSVPTAVVVYDLVPFVRDAHAQARASRIERATIRPALRRADALLCISEATRSDLERIFPLAAGKTAVTPLAADPLFGAAGSAALPSGLARSYVLGVGTLEPRKNLERLLDAWLALDRDVRETHDLALVGPRGWDDTAIVAKAKSAGAILLGRVSDDQLRTLYANAAAFAYPSLYEGFGLPPLEAMAAGCPVLTSNCSSLPEVVGDAALLVDPRDTSAITEALDALLTNEGLATRLARAGRVRASDFTWERTAHLTLAHLQKLARGSTTGASL